MSSEPTPASVTAFTRGDPVAAEQLTRALTAIRDHAGEEEVRRSARQVLDGRRSLREVTRDPEFLRAMGRSMDTFAEEWSQMSPAERAALAERGRADTEDLARSIGLEGEPDPADVGEFGPATTRPGEPSEDRRR